MRSRVVVVIALAVICSLMTALPASAASHDVRAKRKACVLKKKAKCKKANLSHREIGNRNLAGANLAGVKLTGSTLSNTNLAGADLRGADLRGTTLTGVNLVGANLRGATFDGATIDGVDFSAPGARRRGTRSALSVFRCPISLSTLTANGVVAACKGAILRKANFDGAIIRDSDFRGADLTSADFTGASITRTTFNGAVMKSVTLQGATVSASTFVEALMMAVSAQGATISDSTFTDALVEEFNPVVVLTNLESANDLTRTLGLHGVTSVLIDSARDFNAHARVEAHSNNTIWDLPSVDCSLLCFYDGFTDDTFTAEIYAPAWSTLTPSVGITCTGSGPYTCSGTLSGFLMAIYVTPPPPLSSVTVKSVLQNNAATPMSKIRFESVAVGGALTTLKTCVARSSCAVAVPTGTSLRVSVFREHSNGYFGMNCPGETGDAFTNHLTLWPTGDDTLSGDPGDTTRYALHRICDAFTVTSDVTLTAINDRADGAPSG